MSTPGLDFADFYRSSADECLRTVLLSVGDLDTAQDLVDEAFARAWASWRTVSRHPAPVAWVVRTALNLNISRWRRRRREAMGGIERFDRRRGWWAARRRDFDTALR